jgi:hypothetical protein
MFTTPTLSDLSPRLTLALVVAVLLGTLLLCTYDMSRVPPAVPSDATQNLADALRISRGIPFPADFQTRPEPAYRFLLAGWMVLLGPNIFATQVCQVLLALLTVALTFRAGLSVLSGRRWRRLGSLVAAGTMAAIPPYQFIVRAPYRAILVPPVTLLVVIVLLLAYHTMRQRHWTAAGFWASCGYHTHLAGIAVPIWAVAVVGSLLIIPPRSRRIGWRHALFFGLGMLPLSLVWLALALLVPRLFLRVDEVRTGVELTPQFILKGLDGSIRAFFLQGHSLPTFNTPDAPFVNPVLAVLVILGAGLALWHWRQAKGLLLLGGLVILNMPSVVSPDPTYPQRRVGTMPILALLAGWGAASLAGQLTARRFSLPPRAAQTSLALSAVVLLTVSLTATHVAYQSLFTNPARYDPPRDFTSIPHNYSMAFEESMQLLAKVDQPTYVPMWMLDNAAAMFFLQREAFPNVTTWARFGLKELPQGQFFFPVYWYYHLAAVDDSTARVLLLPREKTIVLLPGSGLPASIAGPPPQHGDPGTSEIFNARGWTIVRTRPVPRAEFTPRWPPHLADGETAPEIGQGLRLLTRQPIGPIQPGKPVTVLLEWLVTAPQPADLFSVVQIVNQDFVPLPGGSDHHILFYLYPSARWQPGDIIPDWHVVSLPDPIPDGIYRWGAGAYVPPARGRLPVLPPSGVDTGPQLSDLWLWDTIRVPAPTLNAALPGTAMPINARIGHQIALEGYQLVKDPQAWTVTLYWRAIEHPSADLTVFVHAQHGDTLIAQRDERPLGGRLPTWAWLPGELVTTTFTLELPSGKPEPDALYVGLYSYPSLARLPVVQNGAVQRDSRVLLWSN